MGWTCELLVLVPLFYSIDFVNLCILATSTLIQYHDEFGTLKDDTKDTFKRMIQKGGAIQLIFLLPWDIIPLVIASSRGSCSPYDQSYRIWIFVRATKIIPAVDALLREIVNCTIPYVSAQVGRLIKSIMGLLVLVHISACFFFSLSASQQSQDSWVDKVLMGEKGAKGMSDQYIW